MKKITTLLLLAVLLLSLAACSTPCTHADGDGDGLCDQCKTEMNSPEEEKSITLVEDGTVNFQFVMTKESVPVTVINEVDRIIKELRNMGVKTSRVSETKANSTMDVEILIGNVTNREGYDYDEHLLGIDGYIIKIIDEKIVVTAGSKDSLLTAIKKLGDILLREPEGGGKITDLAFTSKDEFSYVKSDYPITSLSFGGEDARGFTIATDRSDMDYERMAKTLQEAIYVNTGYWLEIVSLEEADKSIIIKEKASDGKKITLATRDPESFKVSATAGRLTIECRFKNMLEKSIKTFIDTCITGKSGALNFTGTVLTKDISVLTYEEYGAKGDGITDDYAAILATHEAANEGGQLVMATPGKVYMIKNYKTGANGALVAVDSREITIQTNVIWTGAEFIIDDSQLSVHTDGAIYGNYIFRIVPDSEKTTITDSNILERVLANGLNQKTTFIDLGLDYPVMIIPYNNSHKVYRRYGSSYSSYAGQAMQDIIVLDKDGNVSPDTPLVFDYTDINYIDVYRIDGEPITVEGGKFTTYATRISAFDPATGTLKSSYFNRGIKVVRPFTTVRGVEHYVEGEISLKEMNDGMAGPQYHGFFSADSTTDVLFENCVFTSRRCYKGSGGNGGTYAINGWNTNNLTYRNCTQSNFWITIDPYTLEIKSASKDTPGAVPSMFFYPCMWESGDVKPYQIFWGCGGTNFCKNVVFDNSTFSRFDAHSGMWNGKIINNCTFNAIALTGGGDMIVEDSTWYAEYYKAGNNALFVMRSDYGYSWDGTVQIKNLDCYVYTEDDPYGSGRFFDKETVAAEKAQGIGNAHHNFAGIQIMSHGYTNWYFGYVCAYPSVSLENLHFYDIMTGEALQAGTEIQFLSTEQKDTTKMHLSESHTYPLFSLEDRDNDGYIDYPYDHDGDGVVGNTDMKYADYDTGGHIIKDMRTMINLNPTKPPEYIKILGNEGGYVYVMPNTSGYGISNGNYYGISENHGGFFGCTKFYYYDNVTGELEYYLGTGVEDTSDSPFVFRKQ